MIQFQMSASANLRNSGVPGCGRCNPAAQEPGDVRRSGTAVTLILRRGRDAEGLTDVLLVETHHEISLDDPVVPLDHDGGLVLGAPLLTQSGRRAPLW